MVKAGKGNTVPQARLSPKQACCAEPQAGKGNTVPQGPQRPRENACGALGECQEGAESIYLKKGENCNINNASPDLELIPAPSSNQPFSEI